MLPHMEGMHSDNSDYSDSGVPLKNVACMAILKTKKKKNLINFLLTNLLFSFCFHFLRMQLHWLQKTPLTEK